MRFYPGTPYSEWAKMPTTVGLALLRAMPRLKAQEALGAATAAGLPYMEKGKANRILREWNRTAGWTPKAARPKTREDLIGRLKAAGIGFELVKRGKRG